MGSRGVWRRVIFLRCKGNANIMCVGVSVACPYLAFIPVVATLVLSMAGAGCHPSKVAGVKVPALGGTRDSGIAGRSAADGAQVVGPNRVCCCCCLACQAQLWRSWLFVARRRCLLHLSKTTHVVDIVAGGSSVRLGVVPADHLRAPLSACGSRELLASIRCSCCGNGSSFSQVTRTATPGTPPLARRREKV